MTEAKSKTWEARKQLQKPPELKTRKRWPHSQRQIQAREALKSAKSGHLCPLGLIVYVEGGIPGQRPPL